MSRFETWPGQCGVFLGKTLNAHSFSLQTGVKIGISELSRKLDKILEGGGGGVVILLVMLR